MAYKGTNHISARVQHSLHVIWYACFPLLAACARYKTSHSTTQSSPFNCDDCAAGHSGYDTLPWKAANCSRREELEYLANTLIFVLAGVIVAGNIYVNSTTDSDHIAGVDYVYALLLWVYLLVSNCPSCLATGQSAPAERSVHHLLDVDVVACHTSKLNGFQLQMEGRC